MTPRKQRSTHSALGWCLLALYVGHVLGLGLYQYDPVQGQWADLFGDTSNIFGFVMNIDPIYSPRCVLVTGDFSFLTGFEATCAPACSLFDVVTVTLAPNGNGTVLNAAGFYDVYTSSVRPTVAASVANGTRLYIGGSFCYSNASASRTVCGLASFGLPSTHTTIAQWLPLGRGLPAGSSVTALAMHGPLLFVSGNFAMSPSTTADGTIVSNYAVWNADGGYWADVFQHPPGPALLMTVNGTQLWAVDSVGAPSRILVSDARFSFSAWTVLATADNWVHALEFGPNGTLYVGGFFGSIGGCRSPLLAQYRDGVWSPLPGGSLAPNPLELSSVTALRLIGSMLYVGGYFYGYTSANVAGGGQQQSCAIVGINMTSATWLSVGLGMTGVVGSLAPGPNGTLLVGTWGFSAPIQPVSHVVDDVMHALVIFFVSVMVLINAYFIGARCRPPKSPAHALFVELYSSFVLLLCAAVSKGMISEQSQFLELGLMVQTPVTAVELSDLINISMGVAGTAACFLTGYISNLVATRYILVSGIVATATSGLLYVFKTNVGMLFATSAVGGWGYGVALTTAIAYYARCTTPQHLIAPMTLVFLCVDLLPSFFTELESTLFSTGLLQMDFSIHRLLFVVFAVVVALGVFTGFKEYPFQGTLLSLREQFRIPRMSAIMLWFILIVSMFVDGAFRELSGIVQSPLLSLRTALLNFGVSVVLVVGMYLVARLRFTPRVMLAMAAFVVLMGICMIIGFMFTNNSIGTLPALFLLGTHLFYGARNLFYGVLTTIFVSVLTENSKGTLIGLWTGTTVASSLIGRVSLRLLTEDFVFPPRTGVYIFLGGTVALFVALGVILLLYEKFLPRSGLPFARAAPMPWNRPSSERDLTTVLFEPKELTEVAGTKVDYHRMD